MLRPAGLVLSKQHSVFGFDCGLDEFRHFLCVLKTRRILLAKFLYAGTMDQKCRI